MTHKKNPINPRRSKPTPAERREKRKHQRRNRTVFFCISIAFLIAGLNAGFSHLMGAVADVNKAHAVQWKSGVDGTLWIFQKETTVAAPCSGILEPAIPQGGRVPKGAAVVRLMPGEGASSDKANPIILETPSAGIVSYTLDGLEALDSTEQFQLLSISGIEAAISSLQAAKEAEAEKRPKETEAEAAGSVAAGQPAFKVVDNLSGSVAYFQTSQILESRFEEGKTIQLQGPQGNQANAVMMAYEAFGEGSGMLLKLSPGVCADPLLRELPAKMIFEEKTEAAVPKSAVTTSKEVKGVYVYANGYTHWRPVTILEETEDQFILEGIAPEEWVVLRPWFVREGMRLKI